MAWRLRLIIVASCIALAGFLQAGCSADQPMNPSFPLTYRQAEDALRQMRGEPRPLERPLVVMAGIHDPGFIVSALAKRLGKTVTGGPIIDVDFFGANTFDDCRERVIESVDKVLPSDDPAETAEVDVVAISMGGLVARYAAQNPTEGGRRLAVRRLFTISSPHRGANLAVLPTLDRRQVDMRAGSAFLDSLDASLAGDGYELLAYVRLGDVIVGAKNAAPPGRTAWWVANPPLNMSHVQAGGDPRIVADIARRLRGETPYSTHPPAPLPGS